jgi:hypothetical protein
MIDQGVRNIVGLSILFATAALISITSAHVVIVKPSARTDNDYLYSFEEGVCNLAISSCNAFCGDSYSKEENPLTLLQVGVPITLKWKTNVAHEPYQYRLSLNRQGGGDNNFDNPDNILVSISNEDAADSTNVRETGSFSATVTIPKEAMEKCSGDNDPCVLQLYDMYYFVSCANVLLTDEPVDNTYPSPMPAMSPLLGEPVSDIFVEGASFLDYRVTIGNDEGGMLDPILYLKRCKTYTFNVNARGHPFVIKTQPGIGLENILDLSQNDSDYYEAHGSFPSVQNQGIEQGTFTFLARKNAPTEGLFYQCTLHEDMVSFFMIVDPDDDDVDECGPSPSQAGPATSSSSVTPTSSVRLLSAVFLVWVVR